MRRLNDVGRLRTQVGEADLCRLLALKGDENILDLGSGTGFYTDRIAALTTGFVYALEIVPEMNAHYRERGLPVNVHLLQGGMTNLDPDTLVADSVDVAITIATWHEIDSRLDVPGVAAVLRTRGRLIVIDWHKDPDSWDNGPPADIRCSADEVATAVASHFKVTSVENVGSSMFALTALRV
jgi:SAM-dependent methyltransferase